MTSKDWDCARESPGGQMIPFSQARASSDTQGDGRSARRPAFVRMIETPEVAPRRTFAGRSPDR